MEIEIFRLFLALAMFATASYFDLKKRSVSDLLWVAFAAAAVATYVFDFPSDMGEGILVLVSIALTSAVAYGIYRGGLFGGADMLALITFSAIMPTYSGMSLLGFEGATFHPIAPLIVLANAVIFSVSQVAFNVLRNTAYSSRHPGMLFSGLQHEPTSKKVLAVMLGHRSQNPQFAFPIERTVNDRREFDFGLKPAETAEYESRKDVWVTTGTPFLIFLAAGLVMMVTVGDILGLILRGLQS